MCASGRLRGDDVGGRHHDCGRQPAAAQRRVLAWFGAVVAVFAGGATLAGLAQSYTQLVVCLSFE